MDNCPLTFLIAEDDVLIRMDLALGLSELGHSVMEAGNAASALLILDQKDIDVLVTDIDMPGELDGLALAGEMRRRFARRRIVVMSGGAKPAADALPTGAAFLAKPPDVGDLLTPCASRAGPHSGLAGTLTRNVVPLDGVESTSIRPPWARAISDAM